MKSSHLTALLVVSIGLTACSESPKPPAAAPTEAAPVAAASVAAPTASPIDNLVKNVVADTVPFQPEAAKIDGNALVSTGMPGFMMFGPYVPFVPGVYRVTVQGSVPDLQDGAQVRFDAVSGGATVVHGEHVVTTSTPANGTIAEFDITIPEGVTDLELRAEVTEGADVRIESYQITKTN